jgi:hypothetical protein
MDGFTYPTRQPLHLLRVGDLDLPTVKLEPIVHETGAIHRLDRGTNRLTVTIEPPRSGHEVHLRQAARHRRRRSHPLRQADGSRDACD